MFKKIINTVLSATLVLGLFAGISSADSTGEVISLGANLNASQKREILNYFGVDENNPNITYTNNQQERKYLGGIVPERQLGHVTMSSSYVVPTSDGGINVKTNNITWVTSSMIASTLATAGIENANVVAAAPFPVSGTGALTGIIIGFEKSSGEKLPEQRKKLANQELVTTGNLAEEVGQDKASGIINDAKRDVIKKKITDPEEIQKVIENVTNKYNVNLSTGDINVVVNLLQNIGAQNFNYRDMKDTLDNISANVGYNLKAAGENVDLDGLLNKAKSFVKDNKEANDFFSQFDDSKISNQGIVSTTSSGVEGAKKLAQNLNDSGFFERIIEFFKNLIN